VELRTGGTIQAKGGVRPEVELRYGLLSIGEKWLNAQ
jgi:hypothetical protein